MADPQEKDKDVEEKPKPKKPPGYRKFEKLLNEVIKAPPMKQSKIIPIKHKP